MLSVLGKWPVDLLIKNEVEDFFAQFTSLECFMSDLIIVNIKRNQLIFSYIPANRIVCSPWRVQGFPLYTSFRHFQEGGWCKF